METPGGDAPGVSDVLDSWRLVHYNIYKYIIHPNSGFVKYFLAKRIPSGGAGGESL